MRYQVGLFIQVPDELHAFVRSQLPPEFNLVTVDNSSEAEAIAKIPAIDFVITGKANAALIDAGIRLKLIQHPEGHQYHKQPDEK